MKLPVQRCKIGRYRHRHPVVAAEVANFTFHAALLVAFARRAELGLILPMRTERDEPGRQLSLLAAQNLLHRARQVIVAQPPEDAFEVIEGKLVRLQKCLWVARGYAR